MIMKFKAKMSILSCIFLQKKPKILLLLITVQVTKLLLITVQVTKLLLITVQVTKLLLITVQVTKIKKTSHTTSIRFIKHMQGPFWTVIPGIYITATEDENSTTSSTDHSSFSYCFFFLPYLEYTTCMQHAIGVVYQKYHSFGIDFSHSLANLLNRITNCDKHSRMLP